MGLFGFVGSVVKGVAKGAACVAAAPVVVGVGTAIAVGATAVTIGEKAAPVIGKAVKEGGKALLNAASEANKVRQSASSMSNSELVDAYKNTTSATKRAGYEAEMRDRTGNW